jgi:hypothetical protein
MSMKRWVASAGLSIMAAAMLSTAAPVGHGAVSAADALASETASPLMDAIRFVPSDAHGMLFTDWSAIKAATGNETITSTSSIDARTEALLQMTTEVSPLATFGVDRFEGHADAWGWDSTDLDWETSFLGAGPPVAILRFRDGFDLEPVLQRYRERGFTEERYGDATVVSHEMDLGSDWITRSDFAVLNTAFVDDGRTLVLSSGIDGVTAALDGRGSDAARLQSVADALGSPLTAGIEVTPDICLAYDPRWLPGSDGGPNAELLRTVGTLHAWDGLGLGVYGDEEAPPVRFVLAYGAPEEAAADAASRVRLAEQAISLRTGVPYAASVFTVVDGEVEGSTITLGVAAVDAQVRRVAHAFIARDLVFAACGGEG